MHTPVLCKYVIENFEKLNGKKIIDCTLGEGGHTLALAQAGAKVLAIDADNDQVNRFYQKYKSDIEKYSIALRNGNYAGIYEIAKSKDFNNCSGILFDLGLSMYQINFGDGFSYKQKHQPLHMVIDTMCRQKGAARAADVLAYKSKDELSEIFEKFGEVNNADRIARKIADSRKTKSIETVSDLLNLLSAETESEIAKVFQALRIVTNSEYENIQKGLTGAWNALEKSGILQVITFHSGEDRIVKLWSRKNKVHEVKKILGKHVSENSFERSAVLRVYKKI